MTVLKRILVTGATGKQGGALISALLASPSPSPFHLVALTRNPNSARAQSLAKNPSVSILQGDLNDIIPIFKTATIPFHGVFSVQAVMNPQIEESQGKSLIDAALSHGVKHFVYTSAERGGPERSDRDGTIVKHFVSKFNIENHLKAVEGMQWTIIRPVAFMDNITPDFFGKAFTSMWELNGLDSKLQLVSAVDIGILTADAFRNPDAYAGKAISFATDELTFREARTTFKRVVGTEMPSTYPFVGRLIKFIMHEQLGVMFKWFNEVGFGADPKEFKERFPEMQSFEDWLRRSSGFKSQIR